MILHHLPFTLLGICLMLALNPSPIVRAMLLLAAALVAGISAMQPACAQTAYEVIDGDTIGSPAGVTYRLLGFDAPETYRARCPEELAIGVKAKRRLVRSSRAARHGILESGRLDRYRRTLAALHRQRH